MRKQVLKQIITRALIIVLPIGLLAYFLQDMNPIFTWILATAIVIGLWLGVAGVCVFLEFLIGEDEQ